MHEIITVQLGQQSNYLATHFWNTQESYFTYSQDEEPLVNHDVHWRPGRGADGSETFMPRTVIYDLKGGFGSMRKINALYEVDEEVSPQGLWNGPAAITKQEPIAPSAYQQSLDAGVEPQELTASTVRYWSDFNRVFFHPRSIIQLNDYELNSSLVPFEKWATGEDLFSNLDKEHDIVDRDLRPFVEEADQMQGIQVMATFDDAWGGFASDYIERLRDEYGKTDIWVWGLQDQLRGHSRDKRLLRLANKAKTLAEVYKHASIVVPIALPRPLSGDMSLWQASAAAASALETAILPSRLKNRENRDTLGGMASLLNVMGKQSIANLQMRDDPRTTQTPSDLRVPDAAGGEDDDESNGPPMNWNFVPSDEPEGGRLKNGILASQPRTFSNVITCRGVDDDNNGDEDVRDERLRQRNPNKPLSRRYKTPLPFPLLDSFPKIFKDDKGNPLEGAVNITASLTMDSAVCDRLKLLRTTVASSIGVEDREALSNDLAEMADEYHEGWSSGSDEGDDD